MLTLRKITLVFPSDALRKRYNFEAVVAADTMEEVKLAHLCNKIPAVTVNMPDIANVTDGVFVGLEVLETPEKFIDFCHDNQAECGEIVTGKSYDTNKEKSSCFLCALGRECGSSERVYNYNMNCELSNHIMGKSSNHKFYVKLELGSIVPGMVMINPVTHILSNAMNSPKDLEEYQEFKEVVEQILLKMYGPGVVIFFEHGSAPDGISSHARSVVHAHTHVVHGYAFPQKFKDMVSLKKVTGMEELAGKKYLSYQEGANGELLAVYDKKIYVQRQFPRQVIAYLAGVPNELSNWRVEPFEKNMRDTLDRWYEVCLQECINYPHGQIAEFTRDFVESYGKRMNLK